MSRPTSPRRLRGDLALLKQKRLRSAVHGRKPLVESLEDRTLLSSYPMAFDSPAVTQFSNASIDQFLGATFNNSTTLGGITSFLGVNLGAEITASVAGKIGLDAQFDGTGGTVQPSYNATLTQGTPVVPTQFNQVISFTPQDTYVTVNGGSFSSTTPNFGYGADLIADLSGSLGASVGAGSVYSGGINFGGNLDVPLFALNENNNGVADVLGLPIVGASPGLGLGATASAAIGGIEDLILTKGLYYGISEDPPLRVKLKLTTPGPLNIMEELELQLSLPQKLGPYTVPTVAQTTAVNAFLDLGSVDEQVPTIAPGSSTLLPGGELSASASGTIAQVDLPVGDLAAAFDLPGLAALTSTTGFNVGPANVTFTPMTFQLQPTLSAAQTITVQPVSTLTYQLSPPADVYVDGVDQGFESDVTFTPGKDTVGIKFEGAPITVTPSWNFSDVLTNEVDLDADLKANLTIGQIVVTIPGLSPITLGPLYQQNFNLANAKIGTLLDQTSTVYYDSVPLSQFTIGGPGFTLSTQVTTTGDSKTPGSGSLRAAVLSANALAEESSMHQTIQLGAGTYVLTLPDLDTTSGDGSAGDLLVMAAHLTIVGAGAGQTFIQADFPTTALDRIFDVAPGADLTLSGLTIEDGNAQGSYTENNQGGGILQEAGSTLDVESCTISGNTAAFGGGILSQGSLTINDSTISGNTVNGTVDNTTDNDPIDARGGGIDSHGAGSSATIENSSIIDNSATGIGYPLDNDPNNNTGYAGGDALGGGLYVNWQGGAYVIENDTFTGNTATGGSGQNAIETGGDNGNGYGGALFVSVGISSFTPLYNFGLLNDTIAYNSAGGGVGGTVDFGTAGTLGSGNGGGVCDIAYGAGVVSLPFKNTILADNSVDTASSPNGDTGPDMDGGILSYGNNLVGNTSGASFIYGSGGSQGTDQIDVDPKLGALSNADGGPTETFPISPGSPAVGTGGNLTSDFLGFIPLPSTDQRGDSRTSGGAVDIGAFQYQYDLDLVCNAGFDRPSSVTDDETAFQFVLYNNGPDPVFGATITDPLPPNSSILSLTPPYGWTNLSTSTTLIYQDPNPLGPNQGPYIDVTLALTLSPGQSYSDTATAGPTTWETTTSSNQATATAFVGTTGQPLTNAVLYHFTDPDPNDSAANFAASVNWGDSGPVNSSTDGSGTVSVVPDPNGGFDVIGTHTFGAVSNNDVHVNVNPVVFSAASSYMILASTGSYLPNTVLGKFTAPDPNETLASDFIAYVNWGDGTVYDSLNPNLGVSVVADPKGGFDVTGEHFFPTSGNYNVTVTVIDEATPYSGTALVHVVDAPLTSGALTPPRVVQGQTVTDWPLFHFDDGDPQLTAGDFTATAGYLDSTTLTGSSIVPLLIQADPAGGFDVLIQSYTFNTPFDTGDLSVEVTDTTGTSSTSATTNFSVGYTLNAGAFNSPNVTTEGQAIAHSELFVFTDDDPASAVSNFSATVQWGDGQNNSTGDGSGSVTISELSPGTYGVFGSHAFGYAPAGSTFRVIVQDSNGATTGNSNNQFEVAAAVPVVQGNFAVTAQEGAESALETIATFKGPLGAIALSTYSASVTWGDGSTDTDDVISYSPTLNEFVVQDDHFYSQPGSYTVSVAITHGNLAPITVTDTATVTAPPLVLSGSSQLSGTYGQIIGPQTLVTFIDPGGTGPLSNYQASIQWGDGTTTTGTVGYDSVAPFTAASALPAGTAPGAVISADLTGNGILDLVVADAGDDSVQVYLGNGDGTFQAPTTYSLGLSSPAALAVGYLTGNGLLDIVTANPNTNTVSVLLNQGGGVFTLMTSTLATDIEPSAVAVGQLVPGGPMDIVTANRESNDVSVFIGNGDGTFQPATNYATGSDPVAVALGPVYGGPGLDIVTADSASGNVSVLQNNGSGGFLAPVNYAVGGDPDAVALATLDGTSNLDIITANENGYVNVLLGNGQGSFPNVNSYAVGISPESLLITNAAGDGHQDIITANYGSDDVSLLRGNSDGTFQAAATYALSAGASGPSSIAAGDFVAGSGALDLVTANDLSNDLSLLLTPLTVTASHAFRTVSGASPLAITVSIEHGGTTASLEAATATIAPAPLAVTADDPTMTYGGAVPALTYTYAGLVNGDQSASFTGGLTTTATSSSGVGGYAITQGNLAATGDYTIVSFTGGTLTVDPAPLTVTAGDESMTYGGAVPALTYTYAGLVNGDQDATLTGVLNTTATSSSGVGAYAITQGNLVASGNYTIGSFTAGTLTVDPASLVVTADDPSMTYGGAVPALTYTYTGLVNGDQSATFTGGLSTTATSTSDVGGYAITQDNLAATGNYTIGSFIGGTLTIDQAPLTIAIADLTKVYGQANPTLTGTINGIENGDAISATYTTAAVQYSDVGGYAITLVGLTGARAGDYSITSVTPGTLTITQAPLTIAVADLTKVYGQANPTLTGTVDGIFYGDAVTVQYSTTATASSGVVLGGYPIVVEGLSGAKAGDYTIANPTIGTLTVTPATLVVAANNQTKLYGQADPIFTATYYGFVLGQDPSVLSGTLAFSTQAKASSQFGIYVITPSGLSSTNYAIHYTVAGIAVTPAPLVITAPSLVTVYGQSVTSLPPTYSGFVNGDDPASLTAKAFGFAPVRSSYPVGSYPTYAGGASSLDYAIKYVPGIMEVTPAPLVITAPSLVTVYGQSVPSLTPSYAGFVNGDGPAKLITKAFGFTPSRSSYGAGFYPTYAGGASSTNYTIRYVPGIMDVIPAILTATPSSAVTVSGQPLPNFTLSYSGFVDGDTAASLTTPVTVSTSATSSSAPGFYSVTASGGSSPNYKIVDSFGILDVVTPPLNPAQVAFVTSLYENILGRTPEPFGLNFWIDDLNQGETQASVAQQIYYSAEALAYRALHPGQTIDLAKALADALEAQTQAA